MNVLNQKLQGSKYVTQLYSSVAAFQRRLDLFRMDVCEGGLQHFSRLRNFLQSTDSSQETKNTFCHRYDTYLQTLQAEFADRFTEFRDAEVVINFVMNPFLSCNSSEVSAVAIRCGITSVSLELEIIDLQENVELKSRFPSAQHFTDLWKFVQQGEFSALCE